MPYFQIVTFGTPIWGTRRSFYRSFDNAVRDARTLSGGSLTSVRVVGCSSRADAQRRRGALPSVLGRYRLG
jgi:hypothetical protein